MNLLARIPADVDYHRIHIVGQLLVIVMALDGVGDAVDLAELGLDHAQLPVVPPSIRAIEGRARDCNAKRYDRERSHHSTPRYAWRAPIAQRAGTGHRRPVGPSGGHTGQYSRRPSPHICLAWPVAAMLLARR